MISKNEIVTNFEKFEKDLEFCSLKTIDKPRDYQIKVFENLKGQNSILFMETGKGKTFISIMLINHIMSKNINKLSSSRVSPKDKELLVPNGKKVVFLVCEVALVSQQSRVIDINCNYKVKEFSGGKKMSKLSSDPFIFRKEWDSNDIFVSTPTIIHRLLYTGYIKLSDIDLLVFDECHHTDSNHPYNLIMTEFYFYNKEFKENYKLPQILGLTASPLKKKLDSNINDAAKQALISLSESLDCKIVIDPEVLNYEIKVDKGN